jgi:hypothetical protein
MVVRPSRVATMSPAKRIGKIGFRRWYERTLIESHAYLVTCFLGMIVVATSLELGQHALLSWQGLARVLLWLAGGATCTVAWIRYRQLMVVAERLSARATCSACKQYAKFEVLAYGPRSFEEAADLAVRPENYPWLKVRCNKCGHVWGL